MPTIKKPRVLAVDLDGTVLEDKFPKLGPPIPGMKEELEAIRAAGWKITIWTVRNEIEDIKAHLEKHSIPFDYINENPFGPPGRSRKIYADAYLDDRALPFNGEAKGVAERVISFRPWHKKNPLG